MYVILMLLVTVHHVAYLLSDRGNRNIELWDIAQGHLTRNP